jgi:hypothetical protein
MSSGREIVYLSPPAKVSMADCWFELVSINHFWIKRRFEVLQRLAGPLITSARETAEFGCGSGLLQRQIEDRYGRAVTGFDLNEYALKRNLSRLSTVYCYDVNEKDPSLQGKFDLILLFDVLEHIGDEDRFLGALIYHLTPTGQVVVNVPAGQWAYSSYDRAAGHVRRYSIRSVLDVAARNNLRVAAWTYWGLPLLPALALRKLWLLGSQDAGRIISVGFDPRTNVLNTFLKLISRCEPTLQKLTGSSLMFVLQVERNRE